ncbi:MAG: hypothetical protein EBZ48_17340, partial [Proteobacteria bacterium]|nr:hypothetical protein [Pseudomonadota bacterium]
MSTESEVAKKIDFKKILDAAKDYGTKGYQGARHYLVDPFYAGAKHVVTDPSEAVSMFAHRAKETVPTLARMAGTAAVPIGLYEGGKYLMRKKEPEHYHGMEVIGAAKIAQIQDAAINATLAHYKLAFSLSPAGHALDAARARNAIAEINDLEDANAAYSAKNPALGFIEYNPLSRGYNEMRRRMLADTARKHEAGGNVYNPLGGILTPVERSGERSGEQKMAFIGSALSLAGGAELARRAGAHFAPTVTEAGHEWESQRARDKMRALMREENALRAYDAANTMGGMSRTMSDQEAANRE